MLAVSHAQRRIDHTNVLEQPFSGCKTGNVSFQFGDIAAHLRSAPLLARVADDVANIGFGCCGQDVVRA